MTNMTLDEIIDNPGAFCKAFAKTYDRTPAWHRTNEPSWLYDAGSVALSQTLKDGTFVEPYVAKNGQWQPVRKVEWQDGVVMEHKGRKIVAYFDREAGERTIPRRPIVLGDPRFTGTHVVNAIDPRHRGDYPHGLFTPALFEWEEMTITMNMIRDCARKALQLGEAKAVSNYDCFHAWFESVALFYGATSGALGRPSAEVKKRCRSAAEYCQSILR